MKFFLTVSIIAALPLGGFAQAGRTLEADGSTHTYRLIESFGYGVEVPDCGHPVEHITQQWDEQLGKPVFAFTLHAALDDDRCGAQDRQRAEIKTFAPSPESMKGFQGQTVRYRWKFRLPEGFQPSNRFCHIHQIKADSGPQAGAPVVTLTPRLRSDGAEVMQFMIVDADNRSTVVSEVDLKQFKGTWVEVEETMLHDHDGWIEMTIRRLDNGRELLHGRHEYFNFWRREAKFNRPKYGIYRSLLNREQLRDETLLFTDMEYETIDDRHAAAHRDLKISCNSPARVPEEALPLSDGRMEAMVWGDPVHELIRFDELASGSDAPRLADDPEARAIPAKVRRAVDRGDHERAIRLWKNSARGSRAARGLPMADLRLDMRLEGRPDPLYKRDLDLADAVSTVNFGADGAGYVRTAFVSHPDRVMVVRVESDRGGGTVNFDTGLSSELLRHEVSMDGSMLILKGEAPKQARRANGEVVDFEVRLAVVPEGGSVTGADGVLSVAGADAATLLISAATDFGGDALSSGPDGNGPSVRAAADLEAALLKTYAQLWRAHIADRRSLFDSTAL